MVQVCQMVVRWCKVVIQGRVVRWCRWCMMVEMCQMVVRWCMKVYDGRNVSDGCQMVYDGVRRLYREGLSDGEDGTDGV